LIPHSRPRFGAECVSALSNVVNSGHTARGPVCEALEARIAGRVGREYAAAVDSGSSALLLALFALSMDKPVRRVGIPAYVCRALLHAVRAFGGEPVCMDCAADLRLDAAQAEALAPTLDAVILVHPFGMIEPMVAEDWPCPVIEDIAQAAGGRFAGCELGSFGEMSVASFYATKPWGGACGGMVLSDQARFHELVYRMRDIDTAEATLPYAGNHQLSDVHAALADCRVQNSGAEMQQRRALAEKYDDWLQGRRAVRLRRDAGANQYRYIVRVEDADRTVEALRACGVAAAHPVPTPISRLLGQACPGAEAARRQCVSLPLLADMSDEEETQMHEVIATCL
jgi:perosamine synthetase